MKYLILSSCKYWQNHFSVKFNIENNNLKNSYSSMIKEDAGKFSLKASRKILKLNNFADRDFTYKIINHEQKT